MNKTAVVLTVATAFAAGVAATKFGIDKEIVRDSHAVPQVSGEPAEKSQIAAVAAAPTNLPDFSVLVEREGPAVVNISVRSARAEGTPQMQIPGQPGDPFYEFFKRFQTPPGAPQNEGDAPPRQGVGSGFIITKDGYILTNAHVVKGADEVVVTLTDKREFTAKTIGVDERTDVALVKIDGTDLPVVRTGDPDRVKVGNWVAAIGSPFGLESTVTAGIVSAKSRSLPSDSYVPFIQTDVAVNPGNSGGPLFNLAGEVIGINSQIYSRSGGYMGLSFAIPIDVAIKVKDDLLKYGKVQRGRIGVTIQQINKELAASFGLDRARGALVSGVEKGGPADGAGVKVGDIILSVNGKPVDQSIDLPRMIGEGKPGSAVKLELWRDKKPVELSMTLGETPSEKVAAVTPAEGKAAELGLTVRPLSSAEKSQLQTLSGVVVIRAEGAAAKAGIRAGDVIIALNNEPVDSAESLKALIDRTKERVAVLIQRNASRFFVPVPLG